MVHDGCRDIGGVSMSSSTPVVREIRAKTVLSKSQIYPYALNPYVGCTHACTYCYARFMKRVTGHTEPWGMFVDVKVNAAELLEGEAARKRRDRVWVSGVCDPYQPLEEMYGLTRRCLEILSRNGWPVTVQTRSPLVLRDLDIISTARDFEVGFSVTTSDDSIRKLFEPCAPPVEDRVAALDALHRAGVRTFAMIAPMLPGADALADALAGKVDSILADSMNYGYAAAVYRRHGLERAMTGEFFHETRMHLAEGCERHGIPFRSLC